PTPRDGADPIAALKLMPPAPAAATSAAPVAAPAPADRAGARADAPVARVAPPISRPPTPAPTTKPQQAERPPATPTAAPAPPQTTPPAPVPPALSGQTPGQEKQYIGQPITLDFENADLKSILRVLGMASGLNMIIDPAVPATPVNILLKDLPWDQALEVILRSYQLGYEAEGTVIRIAPL